MTEPGNARRILILDDDDHSVQVLRRIAISEGGELRDTDNPFALTEIADQWHPHLVVINPHLPEVNLNELITALGEQGRRFGLLLMDDDGQKQIDRASSESEKSLLQVAGVISKPLAPGVVRRLLRFACCYPQHDHGGEHAPDIDTLSRHLKAAITNKQIVVAYQPKIDCATNEVIGFEALARWHSPGAGIAMPEAFIPIAEQGGLIRMLTFEVLEQSLRWLKSLPAGEPQILCVNLSAMTLGDPGFLDDAVELCEDIGIDPHMIIFELAETSTVDDPEAALDFVMRLRMKGFNAALDDVGTGHSSLVQLARLPFSELKVDKSFVLDAASSPKSRAIIRSLVQLGHSLGLRVIGEGVEDQASLEALRSDGCDFAQGYFIAHPMYADHATQWLRERINP